MGKLADSDGSGSDEGMDVDDQDSSSDDGADIK